MKIMSINPSNKQVLGEIEETTKEKTVILFAHTLDSIENFDNIIVLKNGSIVEQGNHIDLMNKKGMYYKLVNF